MMELVEALMAWRTLDQAAEEGHGSRRSLERAVAEERVASYVGPDGRRLVWVGAEPGAAELLTELQDLRREVEALRAAVVAAPAGSATAGGPPSATAGGAVEGASATAGGAAAGPSATAGGPPPARRRRRARGAVARPAELGLDVDELLARIAREWTGSERALERAAGVHVGFFARVRQGRKRTGSAAGAWSRVLAALEASRPSSAAA